jgi:hypothetical protein
VRNWNSQLDVPHALTPHSSKSNFHTTAITNYPLVFDALILSTRAFPVSSRPKNPLTEETTFFRFEGTVVNGFRVFHLSFTPPADSFWGSNGNTDLFKGFLAWVKEDVTRGKFFHGFLFNVGV